MAFNRRPDYRLIDMYKQRRERLLDSLPDYSIALLYSGKAPYSIGDEKYPFEVDRSFYYLTGLDNEDLTLMLVKMPKTSRQILFIEPYDELQAKWVGGRIKPEEASEISGIKDIQFNNEIDGTLSSIINNYGKLSPFTIYGDLSRQEFDQVTPTLTAFNRIKEMFADIRVANLYEKMCALRMCKDKEEIECMRKAIDVTREGIETMMRYSHENIWENELEAYFDYVLKCHQCGHAFESILATGKNATILHYRENNDFAKSDELVLCDLGASYKKYCADVTRTFPVNGKFTDRQKQIYDIVLRGNKYVASIARPGYTTRQLNEKLIEFYQEELKDAGLLENGKTVRDYYWHGVSHTIGLETHDFAYPDMPLKAGCVISNEPGLYLEDEGIGIRIEDDLLITEDGCEVLTKDIIKEIDEIEEFMSQNH